MPEGSEPWEGYCGDQKGHGFYMKMVRWPHVIGD